MAEEAPWLLAEGNSYGRFDHQGPYTYLKSSKRLTGGNVLPLRHREHPEGGCKPAKRSRGFLLPAPQGDRHGVKTPRGDAVEVVF